MLRSGCYRRHILIKPVKLLLLSFLRFMQNGMCLSSMTLTHPAPKSWFSYMRRSVPWNSFTALLTPCWSMWDNYLLLAILKLAHVSKGCVVCCPSASEFRDIACEDSLWETQHNPHTDACRISSFNKVPILLDYRTIPNFRGVLRVVRKLSPV